MSRFRDLMSRALGRRASSQARALAIEAARDGYWDWAVGADELYLSPRLLEICGFAPGNRFRASEGLPFPFQPEDKARWVAAVDAHFAGDTDRCEMELRIIRAGEVHWVELHGLCSRNPSGKPVRWTGSVRDITERKKVESALRKSQERYAIVMEASGAGHWDWLIPTDDYYASRRYLEITGIAPGAKWNGRADFRSLYPIHPEDRVKWDAAVAAHFASTNDILRMDLRFLPRGELRWLRLAGLCIRDDAGKPVRWTGSGIDITERKLAEEALRESEARFRSLTSLSSDWLWQQDENFRFTYLSHQGVRTVAGYPTESSIGKTRRELPRIKLLSSTWEEHQATLEQHLAFRNLECERIGQDGERVYVSVSGTPVFDADGKFAGYQGTGQNITERKRIEEELRSRQEMLDIAQKAARAVAFQWRVGEGSRGNRWSPDLEAMHGLPPHSYDGTFGCWKKLVHAADWPSVKLAIKRANDTGEVATEYRVVHPGGAVHWLEAKGKMLFSPDGKPTRIVGFMLDVTEQRQVAEEMKRMEGKLVRAQRLEGLGTLAGGIAHDFNNILGAILGYGEMALRDAARGTRLRRDLDSLMTACERGRSLVDRILTFSRSGMTERVRVDVESVVRETLELLGASLPAHITIEACLDAGGAAMLGDPLQIHQLVMNLATNAVQAMNSHGKLSVALSVEHVGERGMPTIGTLEPGEYILLCVEDSGCGMSADALDRIFDPFFTMKAVGVGTGLGLSIVHGIVTEVGGAIDVTSSPGKGSRFCVYLPRNGSMEESVTTIDAEIPRGHRQRVLVVDDEPPLVEIATRTLRHLGYVAEGFTSSQDALESFRARPDAFDALLTDERMPGLSGGELIREIRSIRSSIPIVMMSGYLSVAALEGLDGARPDAVLRKPVSVSELASGLAGVLSNHGP